MRSIAIGLMAAAAMTSAIVAGQSVEAVDAAAIARIRDEGLTRSQVMETMFWLTDRYGRWRTISRRWRTTGVPTFAFVC